MAEVGLVTFARVALRMSQAALPAYRSKCSTHCFNSLSSWRCCADAL